MPMAKNSSNILSAKSISINKLCENAADYIDKNNIFFYMPDKIIADEIIDNFYNAFTNNDPDRKNNLLHFNADDKVTESILNECSNTGLFGGRKVVVVRNVRKFLKNDKIALADYIKRSNPDTLLILIEPDISTEINKIFDAELFLSKTNGEGIQNFSDRINLFKPEEFSEDELIDWVVKKFDGYKISKDTVRHLLLFSNYSPGELLSEIEKLKTYCYSSKEVTNDSVNLCNGIAKDFKETDFIKAVISKDSELAIKIYKKISLKKEVEVYLVILLSSAFMAIFKLQDPSSSRLNEFNLKRELKLWSEEQLALLPLYRKTASSISSKKIRNIIENLYNTDILLKSTGGVKFTKMFSLINNICAD